MSTAMMLIIGAGVLAIVYGLWAIQSILAASAGNEKMQEIASAIQSGASAYLNRQYRTIGIVGVVIAVIVAYLLGVKVSAGFVIGAALSGVAGYVGMLVSVRANVRTTQAASESLAGGLSIAFRSGAVTGMLVAGLALLSVAVYFHILTGPLGLSASSREVIDALVALGFGASLISIFARLGGGIFTKVRMSVVTWSVRSKPVFRRMTRATRPPLLTMSVTMLVTAPAWPLTCLRPTP